MCTVLTLEICVNDFVVKVHTNCTHVLGSVVTQYTHCLGVPIT